MTEFSELLGKVIINIERNNTNDNEELIFHLSNGAIYKQFHEQNCCEYVHIEDIDGDLNDLIGYRLLQADESTQDAANATNVDSATWTFYRMATIKGYVTIRWYGSSNGYYSEGVSVEKIKEEDPIREIRMKQLTKLNK